MLSSTIPKTLFRSRLGVGSSPEIKKCPVVIYRPGVGYQQPNCCVSKYDITPGILILDGGTSFASGLRIIDGGGFFTTQPNIFDGGTPSASGIKIATAGTAFSSGQKIISGETSFSSRKRTIIPIVGKVIVDGGKS